ncbi:hypothetical protein [Microlunatus soli]|uniref:Uncharacterized protein n=1 Tax=Microlunatus soli TaxID=630515 RepID=A0A1H1TYU8_9ACTN|nr:hypothetical protein [Microlunatus soli]SDS65383.1 hypothetical protein SAMN04489812_2573 [Microlunatus soli]
MSDRTGESNGNRPPTSAADLLTRLLDLLASATTMQDLDHRAVGQAFGLSSDGGRRLNYFAQLTDVWFYNVLADPDFALGPVLEVEFFDGEGSEAAMTDICAVDLDQFRSRLTTAGYAYRKDYGEHGEVIGHEFTRGPLVVSVVARGEAGSPPEKVTHDCVQSVTVQ